MNKREEKEVGNRFLEVYCGILFNSQTFENGQEIACSYDFENQKYKELLSRYPVLQTAGNGGDFERALRICQWLASNLTHKADFSLTGNIEINSISLLDYALENSNHGLNCVCKSKILVECCLALGIFARRVGLYPNSPFDTDNHVVAEIYDRTRQKWIMLDPTSGGYFTDGKNPLSCFEMRQCFALNPVSGSIVLPRQKATILNRLTDKNIDWDYYYAKNCYYIVVETSCGFGENGSSTAYLLPKGFDFKAHRKKNAEYLLNTAVKEGWGQTAIKSLEERVKNCDGFTPLIGSIKLWESPEL